MSPPKGRVRDPANVRLLDDGGVVEIPCRGSIAAAGAAMAHPLADARLPSQPLPRRAEVERPVRAGSGGPAVLGFTRNLQVRYEQAENIYVAEKGGAWWVNTGELLFKINEARF